jgi:hypothetical protein
VEKEIFYLRSKFYLPFRPATGINKATLPLYKIVAINVGNDPVNKILINRLTDEQKSFISYPQLERVFQNSKNVDEFYKPLGFSCQKHDTHVVILRDDPSILSK